MAGFRFSSAAIRREYDIENPAGDDMLVEVEPARPAVLVIAARLDSPRLTQWESSDGSIEVTDAALAEFIEEGGTLTYNVWTGDLSRYQTLLAYGQLMRTVAVEDD